MPRLTSTMQHRRAAEASASQLYANGHSSVDQPGPPNGIPPRQHISRRNTTGSSLQGRRSQSGNSLAQSVRRSSRDRDPNYHSAGNAWEADALNSPTLAEATAHALRTGDAAFDEEAAMHAEQLRRDRRYKEQKARDAAAEGTSVDKDSASAGGGRRRLDSAPRPVATGSMSILRTRSASIESASATMMPSPRTTHLGVFRELREHFHLDAADYLLSLTSKYILSELGSPGKSGSFFYFFARLPLHHQDDPPPGAQVPAAHPQGLPRACQGESAYAAQPLLRTASCQAAARARRSDASTRREGGGQVGRSAQGSQLAQARARDRVGTREAGALRGTAAERRGAAAAPQQSWTTRCSLDCTTSVVATRDNLRQDNLRVFQPETKELKRQPTQIKRPGAGEQDASALRQAVRRSDPKALNAQQGSKLPDRDVSERRHFLFYQDEGGFRSTDENNQPGSMIYYLGVIDLFTPYTSVKRGETIWKGLTQNRHMISSVPAQGVRPALL
ncbi:hypothetical protein L1887_57960 [Cichorium endivia]|nr:hypothetical protein L1887_57960 [Cichorium endivia]